MKVKLPTYRVVLLLNVIPNLIGDLEEKLVDSFWIPAFAGMTSLVLYLPARTHARPVGVELHFERKEGLAKKLK